MTFLLPPSKRSAFFYYKFTSFCWTFVSHAGMDWLCPGYSEVLARQLTTYHGNITAENTIHNIVSIVQTGDLHVAVYDLPDEILYVSSARADNESGPLYAYERCVHRREGGSREGRKRWVG